MSFTKIQLRRDTRNNWGNSSSIPAEGELCYESTINAVKFGNGADQFKNLPYFTGLEVISFSAVVSEGNIVFDSFKAKSLDIDSGDISFDHTNTGNYIVNLPPSIRNTYFIIPSIEFVYNSSSDDMSLVTEYYGGDVNITSFNTPNTITDLADDSYFVLTILLLAANYIGDDT